MSGGARAGSARGCIVVNLSSRCSSVRWRGEHARNFGLLLGLARGKLPWLSARRDLTIVSNLGRAFRRACRLRRALCLVGNCRAAPRRARRASHRACSGAETARHFAFGVRRAACGRRPSRGGAWFADRRRKARGRLQRSSAVASLWRARGQGRGVRSSRACGPAARGPCCAGNRSAATG